MSVQTKSKNHDALDRFGTNYGLNIWNKSFKSWRQKSEMSLYHCLVPWELAPLPSCFLSHTAQLLPCWYVEGQHDCLMTYCSAKES